MYSFGRRFRNINLSFFSWTMWLLRAPSSSDDSALSGTIGQDDAYLACCRAPPNLIPTQVVGQLQHDGKDENSVRENHLNIMTISKVKFG